MTRKRYATRRILNKRMTSKATGYRGPITQLREAFDVERGLKEEAVAELARLRREVASYRDATLWEHLKLWWTRIHWRGFLRVTSFIR